jgi:hypothetical protein
LINLGTDSRHKAAFYYLVHGELLIHAAKHEIGRVATAPRLLRLAILYIRRGICPFLLRRGSVSNPRLYYQRTQSIAKIGVSRRLSIVIVQHPAELFLASDAAHFGQKLQRFDESVFHPLMIAPLAIVTDEN